VTNAATPRAANCRRRWAALLGVAASFFVLHPALAQTPPAPAAPERNGGATLREVDIRAFIEDVSKATGITFIVDPRVQGKVTLIAQQSLTERELFDVFNATLRVNGFVAVPTARGAYRIVPDAVAAREPTSAAANAENRFVTQVFSLKFADAESVLNAVKPLLSERGQASVSRRGNSVVVIDYGSTVTRLRDVIGKLDQDNSQLKSIALRNTSAAEMARVAQQLAAGVGDDPNARSLIQAVPVASSNSVILRGDQRTIDRVAPMLEQLDAQADLRSGVQVLPLRYAVAEEIVPVLRDLSQSLSGAVGGAEAGQQQANRRANIAAHRATNSLIISADPETQEALARVVRSLDVRRQQILVEAIIVEVSDTAAKDLGLQFLLADPNGGRATPFLSTNYGTNAPNLLALTGALLTDEADEDSSALRDLRRAAVNSLIGSRGGLFGVGGQRSDGSILGLILNALAEDRESNVLSTPSVMTLDNESASLLVGQQIPITTGEALSNNFENQFRTVKREDVGVRLDVRPQISEGGAIRLQIKQEVSSIFGPVTQGSSDLITNRRAIDTSVQVDPGQVIVLGGLIQEEVSKGESGVPYLKDIPVAGRLFRAEETARRRTNLMVFLRPTIVSTPEQAAAVTRRQIQSMGAVDGIDPMLSRRLEDALKDAGAPPPSQR
jgi:general secretion pathway protein D